MEQFRYISHGQRDCWTPPSKIFCHFLRDVDLFCPKFECKVGHRCTPFDGRIAGSSPWGCGRTGLDGWFEESRRWVHSSTPDHGKNASSKFSSLYSSDICFFICFMFGDLRRVCNKKMENCLVELSELEQSIQALFQKATRIDSRLSECKIQLQEVHVASNKAEHDYDVLKERVTKNTGLQDFPWTADTRSVSGTTPPRYLRDELCLLSHLAFIRLVSVDFQRKCHSQTSLGSDRSGGCPNANGASFSSLPAPLR